MESKINRLSSRQIDLYMRTKQLTERFGNFSSLQFQQLHSVRDGDSSEDEGQIDLLNISINWYKLGYFSFIIPTKVDGWLHLEKNYLLVENPTNLRPLNWCYFGIIIIVAIVIVIYGLMWNLMDVFCLRRLANLHFDLEKIQLLQIKKYYEQHRHYLLDVWCHTCLIDISGKSCLVYWLQWCQCCFALDYQSERIQVLKLKNYSNLHMSVFCLAWSLSSSVIQVDSLDAFCSFSSAKVPAFLKECVLHLLANSGYFLKREKLWLKVIISVKSSKIKVFKIFLLARWT